MVERQWAPEMAVLMCELTCDQMITHTLPFCHSNTRDEQFPKWSACHCLGQCLGISWSLLGNCLVTTWCTKTQFGNFLGQRHGQRLHCLDKCCDSLGAISTKHGNTLGAGFAKIFYYWSAIPSKRIWRNCTIWTTSGWPENLSGPDRALNEALEGFDCVERHNSTTAECLVDHERRTKQQWSVPLHRPIQGRSRWARRYGKSEWFRELSWGIHGHCEERRVAAGKTTWGKAEEGVIILDTCLFATKRMALVRRWHIHLYSRDQLSKHSSTAPSNCELGQNSHFRNRTQGVESLNSNQSHLTKDCIGKDCVHLVQFTGEGFGRGSRAVTGVQYDDPHFEFWLCRWSDSQTLTFSVQLVALVALRRQWHHHTRCNNRRRDQTIKMTTSMHACLHVIDELAATQRKGINITQRVSPPNDNDDKRASPSSKQLFCRPFARNLVGRRHGLVLLWKSPLHDHHSYNNNSNIINDFFGTTQQQQHNYWQQGW